MVKAGPTPGQAHPPFQTDPSLLRQAPHGQAPHGKAPTSLVRPTPPDSPTTSYDVVAGKGGPMRLFLTVRISAFTSM